VNAVRNKEVFVWAAILVMSAIATDAEDVVGFYLFWFSEAAGTEDSGRLDHWKAGELC